MYCGHFNCINPCSWSRQSQPSNGAFDSALLEAALHRRYDTFYLVSFKDYVVLPATVINGTVMRPQVNSIASLSHNYVQLRALR